MTKPIKITRQAIRETLKQVPIDQILVGAHNVGKVNLTKKQKEFARKVAEGKPKAQAYREAYDSKGKPQTEAQEGNRLASNPKISAMISAFELSNQAREYLIPAHIRTMAIQNLVSIAINDEEKTSNKLKALELIGKMSEISLFAETKTHVHLHSSADIRGQLLAGLKSAFSNSRGLNDLAKRKAESLLIELSEARTIESDQDEAVTHDETDNSDDPPHPEPKKSTNSDCNSMHSIPHSQSDSNTLLSDLTPPGGEVTNPLESDTCASIGVYPDAFNDDSEGVPLSDSGQTFEEVPRETPPVTVSNEKA
jgi:DNA mismatch repair ATPase MutL